MNNRQLNKYDMLGSVCSLYDTESGAFAAFPAVAAPFSDIKMVYQEIGLNEKIIKEGTKGKVSSKNTAQEQIVKIGLIFAGALYAYAVDTNDQELMTFSDLNSKSFSKLRDSEVPITVESILAKVEGLGDKLIPYGISTEKKTSGREMLNEYIAKFAELNSGKTSKKTANENISMLLEKADKKLKVLDKLMLGVQEANAGLYSKYTSARVIVDKASSHKTVGTETQPAAPASTNK